MPTRQLPLAGHPSNPSLHRISTQISMLSCTCGQPAFAALTTILQRNTARNSIPTLFGSRVKQTRLHSSNCCLRPLEIDSRVSQGDVGCVPPNLIFLPPLAPSWRCGKASTRSVLECETGPPLARPLNPVTWGGLGHLSRLSAAQ